MQFSTLTAIVVAFAAVVPSAFGKPLGELFKRDTVHCGTTEDATLSDCQSLINNQDNWNKAFVSGNNVCHYTNILLNKIDFPAYNTACLGGCCVYYASGNAGGTTILDSGSIRSRAAALLGCADTSANKVNVLGVASDGSGVCISNGHGCGDCFDDADFAP